LQSGTGAIAATAEQQETVRGDQQDFEKDEQVEEITGQEGAVKAEQLHLEQDMEIAADAPPVQEYASCQQPGHQHHDRRQPIGRQYDTKRRRPVTETVNLYLPFPGLHQE
jgi:hypothetical protein